MARLIFNVTGTFAIRNRGIVLLPGLLPVEGERFRIGDSLLLKHPDGTEVKTQIRGFERIPGGSGVPVLVSGINTDEVPPRTEVWSVDDERPADSVAIDEVANRRQEMLLEFLREHDAPCPVCGYNLKALTRPICPECGQELVLAVGAARLRLGWLFAAVAPGFFSGIAAMFLLVPIVLRLILGDGRVSWLLNSVDLFGWCSGAFAILLAVRRVQFIALPRSVQMGWALGIWAVHIAALGLFILLAFMYL